MSNVKFYKDNAGLWFYTTGRNEALINAPSGGYRKLVDGTKIRIEGKNNYFNMFQIENGYIEVTDIQKSSITDDNYATIEEFESNTCEFFKNSVNSSNSYDDDIALGRYSNIDRLFKFGRHPGVGATEEVVWDGQGNYTFLEAAETMDIASTSINDTLLGTGARTLLVSGLDANYDEITEVLDLDGTNTITTTLEYLRVFRSVVLTSGTNTPIGDSNLGDITITGSTTATLQAKLLIGNGQTLMCVYTVPRGFTALITGLSFSVPEGKSALVKAKARNGATPPASFSVKYTLDIFEQTTNPILQTPFPLLEMTDIVITCQSTAVGTAISASFGARLYKNM